MLNMLKTRQEEKELNVNIVIDKIIKLKIEGTFKLWYAMHMYFQIVSMKPFFFFFFGSRGLVY